MPPTLQIYVPLHFYFSLHVDPTLLHIFIKKAATIIYQSIAQYVPASNMPLKCQKYGLCPNYSMCTYRASMQIKLPHMKLLPLMM